jgi:hypothetical protein
MEVIRGCTSLERVIVNNTSVSDASADILASLPKLIFLELGETLATAKTVRIIANSQWGEGMMITIDRFDDSELSEEIIKRLGAKDIYLNFNNISWTSSPDVHGFPNGGIEE